MHPNRFLPAIGAVVLLTFAATLSTDGGTSAPIANLAWVVGFPVIIARLADRRPQAWVATAMMLVMCSVLTVVATGAVFASR